MTPLMVALETISSEELLVMTLLMVVMTTTQSRVVMIMIVFRVMEVMMRLELA